MLLNGFLMLLLCCSVAIAEEKPQSIEVPFINFQPLVDGQLDEALTQLPEHQFNRFYRFDNPVTEKVAVSYRLAYTPTHFYVYIQADADQISYNRRGYLFGDGFKLLLAQPQTDGLTNEYYDLFFSPSKDRDYFERQRIGSYNFKHISRAFSEASHSQEKVTNGKSGFEALIAWSDLDPLHPWLTNAMGYNLYFAKYIRQDITNGYAVVHDEGIWDEEVARRNYAPMKFAMPAQTVDVLVTQLKRKHLSIAEALVFEVAASASDTVMHPVKVEVKDSQGKIQVQHSWQPQQKSGFDKSTFKVPFNAPAGLYQVRVKQQQREIYTSDLVVFPHMDFKTLEKVVDNNTHTLSKGVQNTLLFKLEQVRKKKAALHTYEAGANVLSLWLQAKAEFDQFARGVDPYSHRTEPTRWAFRSSYDNTLQPDTLRLPDGFDASKKYPLLVFMHGSGRDEQGLLDRQRGNGAFIELAPYGRDKFRAYSAQLSQQDIQEAIADVKAHFPVNSDQIVIGGFSMGGYGALRAFYEQPELYRGVAVFSGHPDLANAWLDGDFPNFLDQKYLTAFKDVPVFIYHGSQDAAIHVSWIEKLIKQLKLAGAVVTSRIVEGRGHVYQDDETHRLYGAWLSKTIGD